MDIDGSGSKGRIYDIVLKLFFPTNPLFNNVVFTHLLDFSPKWLIKKGKIKWKGKTPF